MNDERATGAEVAASAAEQVPFILIVCEGPELRITWINAATRALIPGRAAVGRTLGEAFADTDGQQWIDMYHRVYRTGEPVTGTEWRAHLSDPDGSVREIYANFSITAWRDAEGAVRGVIGAGFDVTAGVTARLAAQRRSAHLRERYEQTREVITALQQQLLPHGLPVLPGAQLAASYLLADTGRAGGGDWFDAVVRPDGTLALVVGDVVGHGVAASGTMGQLRAILQDRLDGGADIGEALGAADRFARRQAAARATTVCLVVLDPAEGSLRYCTAGHPPPLVVSATGGTRYLSGTGGTPLGTGAPEGFPVRTDRLAIGDLLLLYSDGVLERPGVTVLDGRNQLAAVAGAATGGWALHAPEASAVERVCAQSVELLVRATGHRDDITLLAAQRVPPGPDLDLECPAELTSLRGFRLALGEWLRRIFATDEDVFVLQHALGELTANAVEHAFDGEFGRGVVRLHGTLTPYGQVRAVVTDHGSWREPVRRSMRGRGLAIASQLVDELQIVPGGTGTVATVLHRLSRPVATAAVGEVPGPHPSPGVPMQIEEVAGAGDAAVRVAGPVDASTATRLQQELVRRSRGGRLSLAVDLTGVTHLASAGVAVLHQVAERHRRQGVDLRLHAAAGSTAQQVLTLVALPHRVDQVGAPRAPELDRGQAASGSGRSTTGGAAGR
jgi:anti-anti-sigma factor